MIQNKTNLSNKVPSQELAEKAKEENKAIIAEAKDDLSTIKPLLKEYNGLSTADVFLQYDQVLILSHSGGEMSKKDAEILAPHIRNVVKNQINHPEEKRTALAMYTFERGITQIQSFTTDSHTISLNIIGNLHNLPTQTTQGVGEEVLKSIKAVLEQAPFSKEETPKLLRVYTNSGLEHLDISLLEDDVIRNAESNGIEIEIVITNYTKSQKGRIFNLQELRTFVKRMSSDQIQETFYEPSLDAPQKLGTEIPMDRYETKTPNDKKPSHEKNELDNHFDPLDPFANEPQKT